MKEIEYGLKYKAQAFLQEDNTVKLNLDLERSLPPVRDGDDYVQSKSKTKTTLICPLGKTAVIAGQKELTFSHEGPSGYAFLRHIPVINWFASSEEDKGEELQMLILVSPELMEQNIRMETRPSEENATLEQEVSERVNAENLKVQENEQKTWFERMFTW
jgi:type II secretory pathway component GspD/PulD (secretin)